MPARTIVTLPSYVEHPYEVFVNGVEQVKGTDFDAFGPRLVFYRTFAPAPRIGLWRWVFILTMGIVVGGYDAHDTIDVVFTRDGRRAVASLTPDETDSEALGL